MSTPQRRNTAIPGGRLDPVGTLALLADICCMVAVPILLRFLTAHVDVWWINALRFSTAVLFWLPFLLLRIRRSTVDRRVWTRALIPLAPNLGQQILYAATIYYVEPAFMSLLMKSSVIWAMVLSMILFADERALARSPRLWLGLAFCAIGIAGVTVFKDGFTARGTAIGVLLALGAAACWGVYSVTARIAFREIDSRLGFSVLSIYTTVALVGLAVLVGDAGPVLLLRFEAGVAIVISAILGIALGHVLFFIAVKRLGSTISALVGLCSPFLVLAASFVVFGETLNLLQWISGVILIFGAGLSLMSQRNLGTKA